MVILRAIGGFFVKIGRWIKKTAWIQPLLIVGGIFAIIFAIPYITKAIQNATSSTESSDVSFYKQFKVNLEGAQDGEGKSDADKLFDYMLNYDDAKDSDKNRWGTKFFVLFVEQNCSGCNENYKAFEKLRDDFGKTDMFKNTNPDQRLIFYTVFVDTTATVNDKEKNLFKDYFFANHEDLFADVSDSLITTPYCRFKGGEESTYGKDVQSIGDFAEFKTPTIFLFDPEDPNGVGNELDVTEALFIVDSKDDKNASTLEKEKTLYDCWFGLDQFKEGYIPENN